MLADSWCVSGIPLHQQPIGRIGELLLACMLVDQTFCLPLALLHADWPAVLLLSSHHLQAMPSQAELAFQQFKQRKKALEGATKEDILAKYGDAAAAPTDDIKALQASVGLRMTGWLALM